VAKANLAVQLEENGVRDQASSLHRGSPQCSVDGQKPAVKLLRACQSLNRGGRRFCYRLAGSLVVLLITCTSAIGIATSDLDPSHHYKLEKIDISGERAFSRDEIASVMTSKERPWYQVWKPLPEFSAQTLNDDLNHIQRFYQAHGYYNTHVSDDLTVLGDRIVLHITIKEGKPVRVVVLQTNLAPGAPSPQALEPSFKPPFKAGDIFEQQPYQELSQTLSNIYTGHSYAHAIVHRHAIVDVGRLQARARYDIKPGVRCMFGNTSISGTRNVSPELVQEQLTYKSGDPFDSRKLAESRAAIVALNVFSAVDVVPKDDPSDPTVVPILISLQEGPKHTLNAGLGYNTQTQLNAMIGFNDYNFLGGGRQFSLTGTYSNVTSALDAKVFQPRFLSSRSSLTLEASQQQQTYQTYTGNISGFDPHVDYKFSSSLTGSVGWRLEYLKFNSVNSSTIKAIGGFRRNGILSGPMFGLTFDNTEDVLNPQRGERVSLVANISDHSLGGDYRYWRMLVEARKYRLIGWRTVLATRLKVGLSDTLGKIGDVPLSERFYSGGEGSVRGYGLRRIGPLSESNDPLGGLSLIEGAVELRRPLFWKLDGALFFDCGQVATKPHDLRVDALQCGYGPAAGMNSPVGPINFYLGFPTQKPRGDSFWQFYFSIGQYF
jgi:outer membrane protein insertion porin family